MRAFSLYVIAFTLFYTVCGKDPVIKTYRDKSVYILHNGTRHVIPDWKTFVSLGYDLRDIQTYDDAKLEAIPLGEPASQILEAPEVKNPFKRCPCISTAAYEASLNKATKATHLICLIENAQSNAFLKEFDKTLLKFHHKLVPQSIMTSYSHAKELTADPEIKTCDIVLNLLSDSEIVDKYACPEMCMPIPYTELPLSWLLEISKSKNLTTLNQTNDVTCTMTYAELYRDAELANHFALGHSEQSSNQTVLSKVSISDNYNNSRSDSSHSEHAHTTIALILKAISQRRMEECNEHHLWPAGAAGTASKAKSIPARKVFGLILWIGSRSRYALVRSQLEVLRNQSSDPTQRIMGWIATEDQYNCRLGSTLCEDASNQNAYFNYMPTTRMNVASAGWSCAQRRTLRAMQHTLLLFDPQFMLTVDDDTYVNIQMFKPGGLLDRYIREDLIYSRNVLGELTNGKKITKRGFYYGGAGYMIGRKLIEELNGYVLSGPLVPYDTMRDPTQTRELSIFKDAASKIESCSTCLTMTQGTVEEVIGAVANTSVRVIEICTNLMSQEHTCFHSDHAISRCLLHGVNGYPLTIACGGADVGHHGLRMSMCMGTDYCGNTSHLTCHRFYPHPDNPLVGKGMYIR